MKVRFIPIEQKSFSPNRGRIISKNILSRDTFQRSIDVGSKEQYPADILSNFTESHFCLDGKEISSMEGFLQSLKTPVPEEQEQVCKLVGYQAKKMSHKFRKRQGFSLEKVFWNGKEYNRNSKEYKNLLKAAFEAKYNADKEFREALKASSGAKLTHSYGKQNKSETILTEKEFISILNYLRKRYKYKWTIRKFLKLNLFHKPFI